MLPDNVEREQLVVTSLWAYDKYRQREEQLLNHYSDNDAYFSEQSVRTFYREMYLYARLFRAFGRDSETLK